MIPTEARFADYLPMERLMLKPPQHTPSDTSPNPPILFNSDSHSKMSCFCHVFFITVVAMGVKLFPNCFATALQLIFILHSSPSFCRAIFQIVLPNGFFNDFPIVSTHIVGCQLASRIWVPSQFVVFHVDEALPLRDFGEIEGDDYHHVVWHHMAIEISCRLETGLHPGDKLFNCVKLASPSSEEFFYCYGDSNVPFTFELALTFVHEFVGPSDIATS